MSEESVEAPALSVEASATAPEALTTPSVDVPATVIPACKFIAPWKSEVLFASIAAVNVDIPVTPSVESSTAAPVTSNVPWISALAPLTRTAAYISARS